MKCIYCFNETEVTNSRPRSLNPSVWRRRKCKQCVAQFSTNELPEYHRSIVIKSTSSKLYPFSRDKLFLSLYKSLGHRKDSIDSATELTNTVISKLLRLNTSDKDKGVYTTKELAKASYETLKRFDSFAGNNYKAYHKNTL